MDKQSPQFALAKFPTPLLNKADWQSVFASDTLPLEENSLLLREVESVAFPNTKFEVLDEIKGIFKVKTKEYPSYEVFVDGRFLEFVNAEPRDRLVIKPSATEVLQFLTTLSNLKIPYVWGGNYHRGVKELLSFYPPLDSLDKSSYEYKVRSLAGVDCSGLLYEATGGFTPRNTSCMLKDSFGKAVLIEGLDAEGIAKVLKPLDLIIWKGHVIIALDNSTLIESRHPLGVIISNATLRIKEVMQTKTPANCWKSSEDFVVKRWM